MAMQRSRKMTMDPKIWTQLPEDLLDRVLSLLPLTTIIRLRPTCKRFHSLLLSPAFLSLHRLSHPSSSSSSYLVLSHPQFTHRFLPLYSSSSALWRRGPLPTSSPSTHLLSSSSGLLLFSLPPSSLLVSNPLSSTSRLIHTPAASAATSTATIVSASSPRAHGYHIFLPSSSPNSVFLYNSNSYSWTQYPGLDGKVVLSDGVHFAGFLYFTTLQPAIVSFEIATGRWERNPVPGLPAELAFVRLVRGGDRLYLVGGVGSNGISRSIQVWEMVGEGWEEVGRLPELMCRKFVTVCYHNYAHVDCVWHEGLVCLYCTTWPELLYFKVARKVWHWLPQCPLLQEKWSCGFRWFSFVPDLCAIA